MRNSHKKLGLILLSSLLGLGILIGLFKVQSSVPVPQVNAATSTSSSSTADSTSTATSTSTTPPDSTTSDEPSPDTSVVTSDPLQDPTETPQPGDIGYSEPLPPLTSDGVKTPSPNGFYAFGLPLRAGFLVQPPTVQYAKEGTDVHLFVRAAGLKLNLFSTIKFYVTRWSINSSGQWQAYPAPNAFTATSEGGSKYSADIVYGPDGDETLPVGIHYFQVSVGFGIYTYYSQLAEVGVSAEDVSATSLDIAPESNTLFANVSYFAEANLNPQNATATVNWNADSSIAFDTTTGRDVEFTPASSIIANQVNTDTDHPGFPETLTATATNSDGSTVSGANSVYVGGLKAKDLPIDQAQSDGITWEVYGLDKLTNEFYTPDAATSDITSASYQWTCYTKNSAGTYVATPFPNDVTNVTGSFSNPSDLNGSQILTIPATSSFLTDAEAATAAGNPYYVSLTLTLNLTSSSTAMQIQTNNAQLSITPDSNGTLSLAQVPNFTFGVIPANQIYEGNLTSTQKPTSTNTTDNILEIFDSRVNSSGWTLQAKLAPFFDANNEALNFVSISLFGLPGANGGSTTFDASNQWFTVASSNQGSAGKYPITAKLTFSPSPNATLAQDDTFNSNLTWNLITTAPNAPPLS